MQVGLRPPLPVTRQGILKATIGSTSFKVNSIPVAVAAENGQTVRRTLADDSSLAPSVPCTTDPLQWTALWDGPRVHLSGGD